MPRVLKPGGYLLAFGATRTSHRMVCAIEDAGFEIRDSILWIYGSGFPKSLDVGKAVDKLQGNERELIGKYIPPNGKKWNLKQSDNPEIEHKPGTFTASGTRTLEQTKGNSQYEGYGTALKPAHEPICVARKPLSEKTVAQNVLKYGTGGINIDGCKIDYKSKEDYDSATFRRGTDILGGNYVGATHSTGQTNIKADPKGRFPANIILDEFTAQELDKQAPNTGAFAKVKKGMSGKSKGIYGDYAQKGDDGDTFYDDKGGASRFFYVAKASRSERNFGLDDIETIKYTDRLNDSSPLANRLHTNRLNLSGTCSVLLHPKVE